MNLLAMETNTPKAINEVYNTAFGDSKTLNQLIEYLKLFLSEFDLLINRKAIVQSNADMLNDLNAQLTEILKTGKTLYNHNDAVKRAWQ